MEKREFYPEIEPFDSGFLKVSDLHEIYYEQSGNKNGQPILYLHGGPGGGTNPLNRRLFNPDKFRIILVDQRGAGKSKPAAELRDNTTWTLVADLERVREHVGVEKWAAFGGSWGSTLCIVYAIQHPDRVTSLTLRGIFAVRRKEVAWFYQDGASRVFPDLHEAYREPIPAVEQHDLIGAYHRRLIGDDEEVKLRCARAWSNWEMMTSRLFIDPTLLKRTESDVFALQFARIESHYFVNGGFFDSESWIFDNIDKIRHIPCTIVQGRYDMVCPMDTAWELHKKWPEADFHIIHDAGHNAKEHGVQTKLINTTDAL